MSRNNVVKLKKNVPSTWEDALQGFIWFKQAEGISERTISDYKEKISWLFHRYPLAYDEANLKQAVYQFMAEQAMPATYNLKLIYCRAFLDWCVREGIYTENPLTGFKKKKAEGRIVNLDEESLKKLIALPDLDTFSGLRDYTLIILTLDTGIRPKEAFSLLVDDINSRFLEVSVRSENAKTRVVYV